MDWLRANWRFLVLGTVVGALSSLLLDLVILSYGKPLWSQEAAGWAQAIGSMGAIAATWLIATRSERRAARQAEAKAVAIAMEIFRQVEAAEGCTQLFTTAIEKGNLEELTLALAATEDVLGVFARWRELSIGDWPSTFSAFSVDAVAKALAGLHARALNINGYIRTYSVIPDWDRADLDQRARDCQTRASVAKASLEVHVAQANTNLP